MGLLGTGAAMLASWLDLYKQRLAEAAPHKYLCIHPKRSSRMDQTRPGRPKLATRHMVLAGTQLAAAHIHIAAH